MVRVSFASEELSESLESVHTSSFSAAVEKQSDLEAMFALYQSWENVITGFAPILVKSPISIFISHAWHIPPKDCDPQLERDYRYYDLFDLSLAKILKLAGFQVIYDKDMTATKGIIDQGTEGFMESEVGRADVVLSFCTPLYHVRAIMQGTGVHKEVERIKQRIAEFSSSSFFIPILLHATNPHFPSDHLMIGSSEERISKSVYLDLRNSREFLSNIWKILHRLFNNFRRKIDEFVEDVSEKNVLLQQYVEVLGKLLDYEDYFDLDNHKTIGSNAKSDLQRLYNSLRTFTTVPRDIDPNELIRQLKDEMNKHPELFEASQGKDIVAFLGNTGVGKSTIINFLAGKALTTDELKQSYQLVDSEDRTAMKIGMGSDSETIYPQWIQIGEEVYFDLPGFSDSKGSVQDLVNAAFIRQVLVKARTVKLVFVVGSDEVTSQRGKVVKQLFSAIRSVFPTTAVVDNSSVLIVNKSTFQFSRQGEVIQFLRMKLRSTDAQNDLMQTLKYWEKGNRILHLPNPSVEDISRQYGVRESLVAVITALKPASQKEVQQFDMSKFYPADIHFPLKNMFRQLITAASPLWPRMREMEEQLETMASRLPSLHMTLASAVVALFALQQVDQYYDSEHETLTALLTEIEQQQTSFSNHDTEVQNRLFVQKEIQLLTEICQGPYHEASNEFEASCRDKLQTVKERVLSFLSTWQAGKQQYDETLRSDLQELEQFLQFPLIYRPGSGGSGGENTTIEKKLVEIVDPKTGILNLSTFGINENQLRIRIAYVSVDIRILESLRRRLSAPTFPGLEITIVPAMLIQRLSQNALVGLPSSVKYECVVIFSSRNRFLNNEENYRYFIVKDGLCPPFYEMWAAAKVVPRSILPEFDYEATLDPEYVDYRHERMNRRLAALSCCTCVCCCPCCLFCACFTGCAYSCCCFPCICLYSEAGRSANNGSDENSSFLEERCPELFFEWPIACLHPCAHQLMVLLIYCYYGKQKEDTATAEVLMKLQLGIVVKSKKPRNNLSVRSKRKQTIAILPSDEV